MKLSVSVLKLSARFLASKRLFIHTCTNLLNCKIKVIGEKLISFCHLYREGPGEDQGKQNKGYWKCVLQLWTTKVICFFILYRVFLIVPPYFQRLNETSCLTNEEYWNFLKISCSGWRQLVFHFGTENVGGHFKKTPFTCRIQMYTSKNFLFIAILLLTCVPVCEWNGWYGYA